MSTTLLKTKLFLPPVRPDRVQRTRLLTRLDDILRPGVRLLMISAPAGFGKTSLLAEWLHQRGKPAAWVSLDAADNAPGTFIAYLLAAIEHARSGLIPETKLMVNAPAPAPASAILATLVNELSAVDPSDPLILALDDFQFITSPEVRDALAFLLEHCPYGLRLAIATRADPQLPLARLRGRGQLVELRAADLRFNQVEAAEFLQHGMGWRLSSSTASELVATLTARTEGWIAGLQMAALAVQSAPDQDSEEFIRSFSGSNRYVLDYLAEEILENLPEETVRFLLQTSILNRFNANLCASVTGQSADQCRGVIEKLDHANLFLVSLDDERQWFRYHHLFADLLRVRLKQSTGGQILDLYCRAATWFEANQLASEAIQYALAGGDFDYAAQLVERHTLNLFVRGELHQLLRWIAMLPEELSAKRPWLCVYRAYIGVFSGDVGQVASLLEQAKANLHHLPEEERQVVEGHCAVIRCHLAVVQNDLEKPFAYAREAREKLPDTAVWSLGVAEWSVGYAHRVLSHLPEAEACFERVLRAHRLDGNPWGFSMATTDLGLTLRVQGRLREALAVYRTGLAFAQSHGASKLGYIGRLLTAYGAALYEKNDLDSARAYLEEAVELNNQWRNPNHLVFAYLNLSRVVAAQGDFQRAGELLETAGQVLRDSAVVASLMRGYQAARLTLGLAQGQPPPVGGALENLIQDALAEVVNACPEQQPFNEVREMRQSLLARVLIAQQRFSEAISLLACMKSVAQTNGRVHPLLESQLLWAFACYGMREPQRALALFDEAAALAAPEGYLRTFLDAAPLLPGALSALARAARRKPSPILREFLDTILAALPGDAQEQPVETAEVPALNFQSSLVEHLTEREIEILVLLAEGLTNPQIAERLIISAGTVKAHTASIFRKLDVANRTQAVTRARTLGLMKK